MLSKRLTRGRLARAMFGFSAHALPSTLRGTHGGGGWRTRARYTDTWVPRSSTQCGLQPPPADATAAVVIIAGGRALIDPTLSVVVPSASENRPPSPPCLLTSFFPGSFPADTHSHAHGGPAWPDPYRRRYDRTASSALHRPHFSRCSHHVPVPPFPVHHSPTSSFHMSWVFFFRLTCTQVLRSADSKRCNKNKKQI